MIINNKLLVELLNGFSQGFAASYIVITIFNEKVLYKKKILLWLFFGLYLSFSGLAVPNQLRFLFSIMMSTFCVFFALKQSIFKSSILGVFSLFTMSISEIVISIILSIIGYDVQEQINNITFNLIINMIIALGSLIIVTLFKPFLRKLYRFFLRKQKLIINFYMIVFLLYLLIARNALLSENGFKSFINIATLVLFFLFFNLIIKNEFKSEKLEEINKQSLNYITKYEKIITEQGKANHEFKNQLMVIRGYAQMKSPKLLEYLDSIIDDTKKQKSTYLISQLNKFPDGGIKGLLYYKLSLMEEEKIRYSLYSEDTIKRKAKKLTLEQIKIITKALGILIDNAIDECKKIKDKEINIFLFGEKGKIVFQIKNTISKNKNIDKIGKEYTTKGFGHGYGLQLLSDLVINNSFINYNAYLDGNKYIVELIIYTTKKKTYK